MYNIRKSKAGFTLIELMVVVAIIGVLALLGLRLYSTQQDKAKEAIVKANAGSVQVTIQTALVDKPDLVLSDVTGATTASDDLSDLTALHNPYSGLDGSTDIANVVVEETTFPTPTATLITIGTNEGKVGVYQSGTAGDPFTIVGYGKGGDPIPDYILKAQR